MGIKRSRKTNKIKKEVKNNVYLQRLWKRF